MRPQIQTFVYKPLQSASSIRVLDWTLDERERPRYRLLLLDLDFQPTFKALSYTWGLETPLKDHEQALLDLCIEIEGYIMPIGANLELALKRIHAARHSGPIWIDALCINQADLKERARQVSMMGRIFSAATMVIAWLGNVTVLPQTVSFLEGLPHVEPQKSFDYIDLTQTVDLINNMQGRRKGEWLQAAGDFLGCAWFSRVWIIQEAVLAKELKIYCGSSEISWDKLYDLAMLVMTIFNYNMDSAALRQASSSWVGSIATIFHIREARKDGTYWPFLKCLDFSRAHGATDPRDKIYALLPLTTWDSGKGGYPFLLEPNYQDTSAHAYTRCAQYLAETTCGLDILSSVSDISMRRTPGLPSWVPDFSDRLSPRPLGGDARLAYDVSLHRANATKFENGILHVSAMYLDEIEYVGPIFEAVAHHQEIHACLDLLAVFPPGLHRYASGEMLVDVLWRTLCANTWMDQFPAPDSLRLSFLCWLSKILSDAIKDGLEDSIENFIATFDQQLPGIRERVQHLNASPNEQFGTTPEDLKSFSMQFAAMCEDRRIFRTRGNLIGITSKSVMAGDNIHLLAGARAPVCLRATETGSKLLGQPSYSFIGEAYVHGIMQSTNILLPSPSFDHIEIY